MPETTLLAIETSCDETGVAIVQKNGDRLRVLAEQLASQIDIHAATGGVVPEIAAREHVTALQPMVRQVMVQSGITPEALTGIAVTVGPGLQPALAVGVAAARTLAYAWGKPLVPVHHLEGHVYSALLSPTASSRENGTLPITDYQLPVTKPFPALALIVSGGHTQLIMITGHSTYEVVGSTKDDAAGEAFDKVARLLGLPYPGGPHLAELAEAGNPAAFSFTRPLHHSGDFNFSFSGLKTAVLYAWRELSAAQQMAQRADLAASFEQTVVDSLVDKTRHAAEHFHPARLLLAGGVAANTKLRATLARAAAELKVPLQRAPAQLCGDNATMIGYAGVFAYEQGRRVAWQAIDAHARLPITSFQ